MARPDIFRVHPSRDRTRDRRADLWPRGFAGYVPARFVLPGFGDASNPSGNPVVSFADWVSGLATGTTGLSPQAANQVAIRNGMATLPYPGQGLPSNASTQDQITYGSTNQETGVIDYGTANYFIKGGPAPASVLAADPLAVSIPSLDAVLNDPAVNTPAPSLEDIFNPSGAKVAGLSLTTWLLIGGAVAFLFLMKR
jgi:hypothetical protein